jgi:hypothetical protein
MSTVIIHRYRNVNEKHASVVFLCHQVKCVWAFVIGNGTRTSSIPLAGHVMCSQLRTVALTANSEIKQHNSVYHSFYIDLQNQQNNNMPTSYKRASQPDQNPTRIRTTFTPVASHVSTMRSTEVTSVFHPPCHFQMP